MSSEQTASPRSPARVSCCFATTLSFIIIVPASCLTLALRQNAGGELVYTTNPDMKDSNRTLIFLKPLCSWSGSSKSTPATLIAWPLKSSLTHDRRDGGPSSNNRSTDPIFIWNKTELGYDPLESMPMFRMKLIIEPMFHYLSDDKLISTGILSYYPFDCDLKVTTHRPFTPVMQREEFGQDIILVNLNLQRSTLIIGYCLVITVTFWMVTLMICLIMITTVVFGYRQRNKIVVVPIGTVFAFTQLRSTMPGAPDGFGAGALTQVPTLLGDILDFAGLLPCLVLLSICAVTMVGIYLFADPHDPSRKAFTWDEFGALCSTV
ncbi:hypothetical protein EV421DRAFT_1925569 [Armillaria borealis]|uniref:Uncharacterized protein n=1 Tax=Armillaria borealis TaxID=47425 RepID=A0AA39IWG7_9AGAR|nr:hypothetical protein EV421DRAFT_1925569 [Armillaria borealis]